MAIRRGYERRAGGKTFWAVSLLTLTAAAANLIDWSPQDNRAVRELEKVEKSIESSQSLLQIHSNISPRFDESRRKLR